MERKDFSIDVVWSDGDKDKSIQALANVRRWSWDFDE